MTKKRLLFVLMIVVSVNVLSQNVGVGTTNPLMNLHVASADSAVALIENTQTLNKNISSALYFKTGNGNAPYTGAIKTIGESTNAARIGLFTYASTSPNQLLERLSITDAGNVGIGIITPQTNLHINPAGAGSLLIGTNKFAGGYTNIEMGISTQSNGYGFVQATKASGTSYGALSLNPNGGNVGIGTSTPTVTLDIHGSVAAPLKVVSGNYTIQSGDYTIVVDMQHDTTKTVNIYLPPTLLNHGRIIKVVAMNMDQTFNYHQHNARIDVYDATGTIRYQGMFWWGNQQVYYVKSASFQCIGAVNWIVTDCLSHTPLLEW